MKTSNHICKIIIILLSTLILLINISLAAENETVEDLNITEEINLTEEVVEDLNITKEINLTEEVIELCNNNDITDAGETCINCPRDVKCNPGEICDPQTEQCTKKSDLTLYIVLGFMFIAIIGFIIFKATRKKETEEPKKAVAPVQPAPSQGSIQAAAEQNKAQPIQKPQEAKQPIKPQIAPVKEEVQIPKEEPKVQSEDELQGYIRQMRAKGTDDETIRQKLRKQGWKDNKVAIAFLTMKKE